MASGYAQNKRMVLERGDSRLDMFAAAISVFLLTADREEFGFMHMMMGTTLILFVLPSFRWQSGIRAVAVLALLLVLVLGKPLDWLRDSYFRNGVSRDVTFSVAWGVTAIVLFFISVGMPRRIGLKGIRTVAVVALIFGVALMAMGQQHDATPVNSEMEASANTFRAQRSSEAAYEVCAYTTSCQSYHVVEAESLAELKDEVLKGLGMPGWSPQGGITYDGVRKHYLQVMVHPRKLSSYP